jgi:hypothetical protein
LRSRIVLGIAALIVAPVCAQTFDGLMREMEMRHAEIMRNLRATMIESRDLSLRLCAMGREEQCDLAALEQAEIILLDVEVKYKRRRSPEAEKIKDAADEARSKVSDIQDLIKRQ